MKELYNPKAFFTHATLLDQGFPHCPIFPTAASRRSLGRVSVPVWLIILSDQLLIVALVSRYLTNKLIRRGIIHERPKPFPLRAYAVLAIVSNGYSPLLGRFPRVTHPSATRVTGRSRALVRLACVKHAASVRSEPGSNSQVEFPINRAFTGASPLHITFELVSNGCTLLTVQIDNREPNRRLRIPSKLLHCQIAQERRRRAPNGDALLSVRFTLVKPKRVL